MDAAAEHHVVAAALQHHVEEEEVPLGVVHHDIVVDNSWVGVDHDYMLQVLLHAGNFGVVVHNSRLTAPLAEADHDDYYIQVLLHAENFAVVVHNDHFRSSRSTAHDIHVLHAGNFGVVVDRVDEAAVEQVLLHRVANYCSIREVVVAADIEVEDRSSCCPCCCLRLVHQNLIGFQSAVELLQRLL